MTRVLIVEDERLLRWSLAEQLKRAGHDAEPAENLAAAAESLERQLPDVVLLDIQLPDGNGLDFFESHRRALDDAVVIVMTAVGQTDEAVRAMKLGALDFLTKPVDQKQLVGLIERSVRVQEERLEVQVARHSRERELKQTLIAESPRFRELLAMVGEVAESEVASILVLGESGSGKNVLARHIHGLSSRRRRPLLEVSCAAIPDQLLESELLGHEKGAFTDAKTTRRGVFELADGGTVVLDEIGELKLDLQAKLLHVLEERRLRRVGGSREIFVDVRVVALTIRDLKAMVRDKTFRQDLFFRLNVFPITVPPLREHPEDILPLARHFVAQMQPRYGKQFDGFSRAAENHLLSYSWPGNIRELRNVVERSMILEHGERISPESLRLDSAVIDGRDPAAEADGGFEALLDGAETGEGAGIPQLAAMERLLVVRAMRAAGDNQTRAAELLGISRDQLRYRLKKFRLGSE